MIKLLNEQLAPEMTILVPGPQDENHFNVRYCTILRLYCNMFIKQFMGWFGLVIFFKTELQGSKLPPEARISQPHPTSP